MHQAKQHASTKNPRFNQWYTLQCKHHVSRILSTHTRLQTVVQIYLACHTSMPLTPQNHNALKYFAVALFGDNGILVHTYLLYSCIQITCKALNCVQYLCIPTPFASYKCVQTDTHQWKLTFNLFKHVPDDVGDTFLNHAWWCAL